MLKNNFKVVFDLGTHETGVCITRNNKRDAVLLNAKLYDAMVARLAEHDPLISLKKEYDAIFSKAQSDKAGKAYDAAFRASPEALGKAAVAQAKNRR